VRSAEYRRARGAGAWRSRYLIKLAGQPARGGWARLGVWPRPRAHRCPRLGRLPNRGAPRSSLRPCATKTRGGS